MTTTTSHKSRDTTARDDSLALQLQQRARRVTGNIGATTAAAWLGIPPARLGRWRHGTAQPTADDAQKLIDLDYVLARTMLLWLPAVAVDWLTSPNAHLDGSRPIDEFTLHGPSAVIDALDATAAGAYA